MGGGAKSAHKALDAATVRQMVSLAIRPIIEGRMTKNIAKVAPTIEGASGNLRRQLQKAIRTTWTDAGVRAALAGGLRPGLKTTTLKREAPRVVAFQSGSNLSNVTLAKGAIASFTAKVMSKAVTTEMARWFRAEGAKRFSAKGADGTVTSVGATYSKNVSGAAATGATKTAATGIADSVIGTGPGGLPKIGVSPNLIQQLEALPAYWKTPGKGLDTAYTPAIVLPKATAAAATAVAGGLAAKVPNTGQLYRLVYDLVQQTVSATAKQAVLDFARGAVKDKVTAQLDALGVAIDNEISAAMGMTAGGVAAKSADPNIKAVATKLHGMLKASQNPASWKSASTISPGRAGAGQDVKYTASSMMGGNVTAKSGFRADMIGPIVNQFNSHLKRWNETDFKASTR
jgi:hypothetical protein